MLTLPKKLLITFVLITCMLSSFFVGTHTVYLPLYVPVIMFAVFLIFIIKPVYFINNIVILYKKTPFKYLVWFSLWAFFTIVINAIYGRFFLGAFINSTIGGLLTSVLLPVVFVSFVCPKYISYKYLIKFIYLFCWIIFVIAFIEFIVYYFDIPILKDIVSIFSTKRSFMEQKDVIDRVFISLFPRCRSIFDEPSYLGYFTFVLSPVIYELTLSKSKIYNNIFINKLIKKTIIPFLWLAIIFCQSPIFFIFNLIFTGYYFLFYRKGLGTIIKLLKKHIILITSIFIFCIISVISFLKLININYEETFLNRIILLISSVNSFEAFIFIEPSLATRIVSYINEFILGIKNIIFGVGYGNMAYVLNEQLSASPLPLTMELYSHMLHNSTSVNGNIFCKVFSETSFIGSILFYCFIYKVYSNIKQKYKHNEQNELISASLQGLTLSCIIYIISSLYDSIMNFPCFWILFAIILCACKTDITTLNMKLVKHEKK